VVLLILQVAIKPIRAYLQIPLSLQGDHIHMLTVLGSLLLNCTKYSKVLYDFYIDVNTKITALKGPPLIFDAYDPQYDSLATAIESKEQFDAFCKEHKEKLTVLLEEEDVTTATERLHKLYCMMSTLLESNSVLKEKEEQ
jgi:hypothetical protein